MKRSTRILTVVFLVLTLMILQFHSLYGIEAPTLFLRFGVRIALLLATAVGVNKHKEQKILVLAFLLTVVSDYFFVYLKAVDPDMVNRKLFGMIGFIAVYLVLIVAFQRNFRIGKAEIITALPFVGSFLGVMIALRQYMTGLYLIFAVILGAVLVYAGMTMVATLYRGFFNRRTAWLIALSGCILFISDIIVAYSMFHPEYNNFILWKDNTIWLTYMIGWLMLLFVAVEDRILIRE